MKLAIIGSRSFIDYEMAKRVFACYFKSRTTEIVSGGAKGADLIGKRLAEEFNTKYTEFLPDWDTHGKAAGFIRNKDIIKNATFVLAFWDGVSRGTENSLNHAKEMKKPTMIIYV